MQHAGGRAARQPLVSIGGGRTGGRACRRQQGGTKGGPLGRPKPGPVGTAGVVGWRADVTSTSGRPSSDRLSPSDRQYQLTAPQSPPHFTLHPPPSPTSTHLTPRLLARLRAFPKSPQASNVMIETSAPTKPLALKPLRLSPQHAPGTPPGVRGSEFAQRTRPRAQGAALASRPALHQEASYGPARLAQRARQAMQAL